MTYSVEIVHQSNGIESETDRAARVDAEVKALSETDRDRFDAWCQDNEIPPWRKNAKRENVVKVDAWLRADAGEEPFEVDQSNTEEQ